MPDKPFAQAADQNRHDILLVLQQVFHHSHNVLEIGSGTGQHAVHFAKHLSHLTWQASDIQSMLAGIQQWISEAALPNLPNPIALDVNHSWPEQTFDAVFAANVAHIMHWPDIEAMFSGVGKVLSPDGHFCLYGPFNIDGQYTSESNQRFDTWLKRRDPESGLRDKAELDKLAIKNALKPAKQWDMPANNKILSWTK